MAYRSHPRVPCRIPLIAPNTSFRFELTRGAALSTFPNFPPSISRLKFSRRSCRVAQIEAVRRHRTPRIKSSYPQINTQTRRDFPADRALYIFRASYSLRHTHKTWGIQAGYQRVKVVAESLIEASDASCYNGVPTAQICRLASPKYNSARLPRPRGTDYIQSQCGPTVTPAILPATRSRKGNGDVQSSG
jgi:hypothetical protein